MSGLTKAQVYGAGYRALRPEVLARNDGICAYCGINPAAETHHGMVDYVHHSVLRADQLVQLCGGCHDHVTSVRKWQWQFNANPDDVHAVLRRYMETPAFKDALRGEVGRRYRQATAPDARREPNGREMNEAERGGISAPEGREVNGRRMKDRYS